MKFRTAAKKYGAKLAVATVALSPVVSHAALPEGVATLFTQLGTDFAAVLALAFTLLLGTVGGPILMGWVKRLAKRGS